MLITDKKIILDAFKRMAETGLLNKEFLLLGLQKLVTDKDVTKEDVQPIVNILVPFEQLSTLK